MWHRLETAPSHPKWVVALSKRMGLWSGEASQGSAFLTMLGGRGMKSVVHEKPILVRLPSSENMCGRPNRQKAKALKYSTRSCVGISTGCGAQDVKAFAHGRTQARSAASPARWAWILS